MTELVLPSNPSELRGWLQEHAQHLLPALGQEPVQESGQERETAPESTAPALTQADVQRLIAESLQGTPTVDEFEQRLREQTEQTLNEREEQRRLSDLACRLIENAEGILPKWKGDLKGRYQMLPSGPPATLLVEGEVTDEENRTLTPEQVIEARVNADLDHVRDLIAEATGKPRVRGEGGGRRDPAESAGSKVKASRAHWRKSFVNMGLAESEDKAAEIFGGAVEG